MILVRKRYPGEIRAVTEFVQPDTYMVRALASAFPSEPIALARAAYDWVCTNIRYPPGPAGVSDFHYEESFGLREGFPRPAVLLSRQTRDFWQFPSETLAVRIGDCEDMAILLCSILRTRLARGEAMVTVGCYRDQGHAWVTFRGTVLDPALRQTAFMAPERPPYQPWFRFDDATCVPVAPGIAWQSVAKRG